MNCGRVRGRATWMPGFQPRGGVSRLSAVPGVRASSSRSSRDGSSMTAERSRGTCRLSSSGNGAAAAGSADTVSACSRSNGRPPRATCSRTIWSMRSLPFTSSCRKRTPMPLGRSAPCATWRTQSTLARPAIRGASSARRTSKRNRVSGRRGLSVLMNIPPREMFAEYSLMKLEKCSNSSTTSRSSGTRRDAGGRSWESFESLIGEAPAEPGRRPPRE